MTDAFDIDEFSKVKSNFDKACKQVTISKSRNRKLTTNRDRLIKYKENIVKTFNDQIEFFRKYDGVILSDKNKTYIKNRLEVSVELLKKCFQIFSLKYIFSENNLATIDINRVEVKEIAGTSDSVEHSQSIDSITFQFETTESESSDIENETVEQNNREKMPQTKKEFMAFAAQTLNFRFSGKPDELETFVAGVELLEELVEDDNRDILKKFVLTRLEGEARDAVPENPASVTVIINALRNTIKREPSKVIEGKLLALKSDGSSLTKFTEKAEELVEKYKRSLISEGFTKGKAEELTIEKTIEMCRKSARSDTVRAVLAAKTFDSPKEVIAKMIIEINALELHKNSDASQNKNGRNFKNNGAHRGSGFRNFNRYQNQYGRQNRNFNENGNNSNSENGNNRNIRGGYRGRGGRGGYHNGNNGRNQQNGHTIRIISGNDQAPSQGRHNNNQNTIQLPSQ